MHTFVFILQYRIIDQYSTILKDWFSKLINETDNRFPLG